MAPKVSNIWLSQREGMHSLRMEIRIDFDNDRHHAVEVEEPFGHEEVERAFKKAAGLIRSWTPVNEF